MQAPVSESVVEPSMPQPPSASVQSATASSAPRARGSGPATDMLQGMGQAIKDLDDIGTGLPEHELPAMDIGPGGVVGALARNDTKVWAKIAKRLGRDWWCRLDWGAPPEGGWERVVAEGERAWPLMTPGKIFKDDGTVAEGVSPSGVRLYASTSRRPRGAHAIICGSRRGCSRRRAATASSSPAISASTRRAAKRTPARRLTGPCEGLQRN